jgi:hypothetical protein
MTILERAPAPEGVDDRTAELLFREARQRRRRRWGVGIVVALLAAAGTPIAILTIGGQPRPGPTTSPSKAPGVPLVNDARGSANPIGLGSDPTPIYFLNSRQGWIAIACNAYCYQYRPAIIHTSNGGRTWRVIPGPDIGSVSFSAPTWMTLGGTTEVRFVDPQHGFYLQVGELWTTTNGGSTWRYAKVGGPVVSMATMGTSAWALVSHCPRFPLSCSEIDLYHWSTTSPEWVRSGPTLSVGRYQPTAAALTVAGGSLFMSLPGHQYRVAPNGSMTAVSTACWAIQGPPGPGQLVGVCALSGGGDASTVRFGISTDRGRTWTPTVGAPPPRNTYNYAGSATTNGNGTLWFVVGGGVLFRSSTTTSNWREVYVTQPGSEEELYPIVFASPTAGFIGETGNESASLLKTSDAGSTWQVVASTGLDPVRRTGCLC